MKDTRSRRKSSGLGDIVFAVLLAALPATVAHAMSTTTVQGVVYRANGDTASGTLIVNWPAFTTASNEAIAAGSTTASIGEDGFVSLNLAPNVGALPAGTYYTAIYHLSDGNVSKEYWAVPAQANAAITSVRSELVSSTIPVQSVTKGYVDATIMNTSASYLPLKGGSLQGPLALSNDPTSDGQAATKHYVDTMANSSLQSALTAANNALAVAGAAQTAANSAVSTAGGTLSGPLSAPMLGGLKYAAQNQLPAGSGNNGIAKSWAANQTVVADPSYALTEQYDENTMAAPQNFHFEDYRGGRKVDYYHNWSKTSNFGDPYGPGALTKCRQDGATAGTTVCFPVLFTSTQPGWSVGNPGMGVQSGWQTHNTGAFQTTVNGEGIDEALTIGGSKYGNGDWVGFYSTITGDGGWTAASDEGTKSLAASTYEDMHTYTGTVTSGAGTGSTAIKTTPVTNAGGEGVGHFAIDTSKAPLSTTVSAVSNGSSYSTVTIAAAVPVSNAWGNIGGVSPALNLNPPFTTPIAFMVSSGVNGTFDTNHLACFTSSIAHECLVPSAVGATISGTTCTGSPVAGSPQCVAGNLRRTHGSGSLLMQGGMAGYGLENPAETPSPAGQPLRHLSEVVGSTNANTIVVQSWKTSTSQQAMNVYQPTFINLSNLSNSGTTVTATYSSSGSTVYKPWNALSAATVVIAGASDSALNGTCANLTWAANQSTVTCTYAGLSGTHTAATASASTGPETVNLYPMAEVLDVQNYATNPVSVDGTLTLEPNIMTISNGDTIEITHHLSSLFAVGTMRVDSYNPHTYGAGLSITTNGIGNGLTPSGGAVLSLSANPIPGQSAPDMMHILGPYSYGLYFDHMGSLPSGALIQANCAAAQAADVNYVAPVYQVLGNGASAHSLSVNCNTGADTIQTPGTLTLSNTGTVFTSTVSAPQVTATSGSATNAFAGSTTINNLTTTGNGNFGGSNTINNPTFTGTLTMPATGVSAGSYTNPSMSVGADGRVTAISSGSAGGGFPSVVAHTALTAQTGPVAPLFSYTPPSAGLFRLTIVAYTTAAGGTGCNLSGGAYLSPVAGHTIGNGLSVACTAAYSYTTATFTARNAAGSTIAPNINISGTAGSLQYMVDAVLEQLQ